MVSLVFAPSAAEAAGRRECFLWLALKSWVTPARRMPPRNFRPNLQTLETRGHVTGGAMLAAAFGAPWIAQIAIAAAPADPSGIRIEYGPVNTSTPLHPVVAIAPPAVAPADDVRVWDFDDPIPPEPIPAIPMDPAKPADPQVVPKTDDDLPKLPPLDFPGGGSALPPTTPTDESGGGSYGPVPTTAPAIPPPPASAGSGSGPSYSASPDNVPVVSAPTTAILSSPASAPSSRGGGGSVTPQQAAQIVDDTFGKYLHRAPTSGEFSAATTHVENGQAPDGLAAQLIGSGEYFRNAGGTNPGFVKQVYADVLGRAPNATETSISLHLLQGESRTQFAAQVLQMAH